MHHSPLEQGTRTGFRRNDSTPRRQPAPTTAADDVTADTVTSGVGAISHRER